MGMGKSGRQWGVTSRLRVVNYVGYLLLSREPSEWADISVQNIQVASA